ncbi:substrate-binding domain-containing protein [Ovoidimarina sediminis]|uniref:substrate-binding domain-containing protein n=1 Tax=Ovoidimarina sediminis TaxID=3079856 RepID=UPI00290A8B35|nr:substrate-binding domain-containing protein [Rhodophyticola sp. MJ-SS7]MDU8942410.1 OmpA family protein [Rhodophyticola sp. MJ-SS7]
MFRFCLTAGLAVLVASGAARADTVDLTARTGTMTLTGELLNFDGTTYRIASQYGIVTVNADAVNCDGPGCPGPDGFISDWMISGASDSTRALIPPLIEAFAAEEGLGFVRQVEDASHELYVLIDVEAERDVARIRLRHTTAREGFADLVAETADMAMALRPPGVDELMMAADAGLGPLDAPEQARVVALDAIVVLAGNGVAVDHLPLGALRGVLSGEVTGWAELGGPEAPITVHLPTARSGAFGAIRSRLSAQIRRDAVRHDTPEALAEAVAGDPFGLGLTLFSAGQAERALGLSGPCGYVVRPTLQALKSEDYPLTVPHYLHRPSWRLQPVAQRFVRFLGTGAAQDVVARAGFADQKIDAWPMTAQGARLIKAIRATGRDVGARSLRQVLDVLGEAERLTPTFRFEGGSDALDAPSRASVRILAEAIRRGEMDDARLILAGFTDAEGGPAANADLSRRRAEAVRAALFEALGPDEAERVPLALHGFGEAMPIACDGGAWQGETNRRVEVWRVHR